MRTSAITEVPPGEWHLEALWQINYDRRNALKNKQDAGYMVIWEFQVKVEMKKAFEAAYGPDGDWVHLFEQSAEFAGTELILDVVSPERYVTIDSWTSQKAYEQFRNQHAAEYKKIDVNCENFTVSEKEIGQFNRIR